MAVDPVSLAIDAALVAANMAMTASQTTKGPRLTDTKATLADYGTTLNYFRGTRLLSTPCFFGKPIQEVKKKRKGKGGKQVSYTGFGTWAVHVADHSIGGVLQVWFDNHLVYDNTGASEKIYPLADDYELEAHMRVYLGTEDQDPDPDMLTYIEARDGAGTCPAYKGTSYIYFENIPLEQLGNRYPDVRVLSDEQSAVSVAAENEIVFVGQMTHTGAGTATGDVTFALTGGTDATPHTGDLVIIVSGCTSISTDSDYNPFPNVGPSYTRMASTDASGGNADHAGLTVWYKVMGGSPDTTWNCADNLGHNGSSAWQVIVFRNVDPVDTLAAPAQTTADGNGLSLSPPDILYGGAVIDPGTMYEAAVARRMLTCSFALRSTGGQALPVAAACTSLDLVPTAGNFSTRYYATAGGGRAVTVALAWGEEVLIGQGSTLGAILTKAAQVAGLDASDYDFGAVSGDDYALDGYNWTQGTGRQICEALCDLYDVDIRPHEFIIQALPRGGSSGGSLPNAEFVSQNKGAPYTLPDKSDSDLSGRVFLTFADSDIEQQPNVAMPQGVDYGGNEISIDMQTLALTATRAQQLTERRQRRERFGRFAPEFTLTRQRLALEPGDVWTPSFDGDAMTARCTKLTIGADGKLATEWDRDDPAIATLPGSTGAPAAGNIPDTVPDAVDSQGFVLDIPLIADAHDQSAPLAYLAAGPAEPGTWTGADYALSGTGELDSYAEGWDGITSDSGAVIGTCATALPAADPWVPDYSSSVSVTINAGELTAATLDQILLDDTLNLAAIQSVTGWELVQFMTPTLTGTLTYTITGFVRGVRGTEWAMDGHAPADAFVLLDTVKKHTLGASEIGDTDYYIVSTTGSAVDQTTAFPVTFTGASHKPYAPVYGTALLSGFDWVFDATRRTRIGGATLDGQNVPLGEASESWSLDIYDGPDVVRTITGASLPLTWTAAMQTTDFGGTQSSVIAILYQVDPTLSLRGYPLALAA